MKKFFTIVCVIALFLIVSCSIFVGFASHEGKKLDSESQQFVDNVVPKILRNWDFSELKKYYDTDEFKKLKEDEISKFFAWSNDKLGKMLAYQGSKGGSNVAYFNGKKTFTAKYLVKAKFEKGEADIQILLSNANNEWKILGFYVNSPAYMNDAKALATPAAK